MARPKSPIPLVLKPIRMFEGDFEKMQVLFPRLGAGVAIRTLVRNYIKQIEGAAVPIEIELPADQSIEELINDE